jgi:hypothetical protein
LTLAVLCHLPNQEGYHEHRLDVINLTLKSMVEGLPDDIRGRTELMVYLNDVCAPLTYPDVGELTVIQRQKNAGAEDAKRLLLAGARAKYVAYSDDDVFYWPGWYEASRKVLDAFKADRVSCCPFWALRSAEPARVYGAKPRDTRKWDLDWWASIHDPVRFPMPKFHEKTFVVQKNGVEAYGGAHHLQFLTSKALVLAGLVKRGEYIMQGGGDFETAIEGAGLRSLCTTERYCLHIGNVIDGAVKAAL